MLSLTQTLKLENSRQTLKLVNSRNIVSARDLLRSRSMRSVLNYCYCTQNESDLVEAVDRDLRKMLINPTAKEPLVLGVRVWPRAIPQFLIGHLDHLEAARGALSKGGFEGLFLGGNYVAGVALGRCVEGAYETAEVVSNFLSKYAYC